MFASYARIAMVGIALLAAAPVRADDLADFNAAVEAAESHNRVAIGYLRTGNIDLASLEIDRLRQTWGKIGNLKRPEIFERNLYVAKLTDIGMRLVTADLMLNSGRPDSARQALEAVRADLYDLRKSAGVAVLADCIRDSSAAAEALMVYDGHHLDWNNSDTVAGLTEKAAAYAKMLQRCDAMASPQVHDQPEFRRLIDGAADALGLIPQAVRTHNTDLVHRVLIQLRSFDNLLEFRFG